MAAHAETVGAPADREGESSLAAGITKKTLLLFIVGDILGGGIYARTGEVAGEIGGAIWTEGTAQAALLMSLMDQPLQAARLMRAVARNRAADGSYFAASRDTDTGFRLDTDPGQARRYFHTPHLGALAWAAMAQRRFNPFVFAAALPRD